jgi:Membrane-associating domain
MIHEAMHGNPSVVNYQIFVGAFSFLSLIFILVSAKFEGLHDMKAVAVLLDWLNTLFFFAGGVALAAKLGVHSCSNHVSDISVEIEYRDGAVSLKLCGTANSGGKLLGLP